MAPRRVKPASSPAWYEPALDAPNVSEKNLVATRLLTVGENNEKGKTELRAGSAVPEASKSSFYPFFMSSIVAGLVPPFSDFFFAVLRHFKLHALHLHPNSILLLSIFAFYHEAFLGVMPSMALLRHLFYLRVNGTQCSGCTNFVAAHGSNAI